MKVAHLLAELIARGLVRAQAEQAMWLARDAGALRFARPAAMLEDQEAQGEIPEDVILEVVLRSVRPGVVATSPAISEMTMPVTLTIFQQIIAAASKELIVASPYLDDGGAELLRPPLVHAARRGVHMRLLTRETARRELGRTRGLEVLHAVMGNLLHVRDYHFEVDGRQHTSLHAKLLMADDVVGYVGSAELRRNALANNFELGVVLHLPETTHARHAFETFWEIADEVRDL
jgi:phosphatidylserine/phosphatidylglycerophosphate/cardiolipin synthase-like enzyme